MVKEMRKKKLRTVFWPVFNIVFFLMMAMMQVFGLHDSIIPVAVYFLIAAFFVINSVIMWRRAVCTQYMRGIEDFCNEADDPLQIMNQIEHTWANGLVATDHYRMDGDYCVYCDGKQSAVFPWEDVREFHTAITYQPGEKRSFTLGAQLVFGDGTTEAVTIAVKTEMKAAEEKLRATEREMHALLAKRHPAIWLKSEPKIRKKALV